MKENMIEEDENITAIKKGLKIFGGLIALIIVLVVFFGSFYIVSAGERGIVLTWGNPAMVPVTEGLHFKMPIAQSVVIMDIKTQKYEADLTAASKDLQDIKTKIAVNYHLVGETVPKIYKEIGIDYAFRVIQPLEQETNKAITSQFTAEELITRRDYVRQQMKDQLAEKLMPRGIVVEEVSIINFEFSPSFTAAIEAKQVSQQQALQADYKLKEMQFTAEAMKLQTQVIEIKKLDIQREWIAKWSGQLPQTLITSSDSVDMLLSLPTKE